MPEISGATSTTYTPTSGDVGRRLRYKERATGPGGTSAWIYTEWSEVVVAGAAGERLLIDASGDQLLIDASGDGFVIADTSAPAMIIEVT
jgi:hypothetical protein